MDTINISSTRQIPIHYIVALPRTGSTLLVNILNQNPQILSTIEEPFKYNLYPKYASVSDWDNRVIEEFCYDFFLFSNHKLEIQSVTRENLVRMLKKHQKELNFRLAIRLAYMTFFPNKKKTSIQCIVDKELKYYKFIRDTYERNPNSKFIILYREPVDNIYRWHIMRKKRGRKHDIKYLSTLWNNRYKGILSQLKDIPNENIYFVRYADLIQSPEVVLPEICKFLSVEMDERMLSYDDLPDNSSATFNWNNKEWKEKHAQELTFHTMIFKKPDISKIGEGYRKLYSPEIGLIKDITQEVTEQIENRHTDIFPNLKYNLNREKLITLTWNKLPFSTKKMIKKVKYGSYVRSKYYGE